MEHELLQKKTLFNELYDLDNSDEEQETCDIAGFLETTTRKQPLVKGTRHLNPLPKHKLILIAASNQAFERTAAATLPQILKPVTKVVDVVKDTPPPSTISATTQKIQKALPRAGKMTGKARAKGSTSKVTPKIGVKRKRAKSLEVMPESQQIFKGQAFYFFPNNDKSLVRKARIRKAIEWGAVWVQEWNAGITHVVFDKDLCYTDLLKFLKVHFIPTEVIMVNDVYPSDCITYRFLVNPNQQLYRVKGHQQSEIIQRPSSPVSSSSASLVLKPAKGKLVQHPQTPCRAEESEQLLMYQQRARIVAEQGTSTKLSKYTQDVLDEAIEEVKEFRDLPLDLDDDSPPSGMMSDDSDDKDGKNKEENVKLRKISSDKSWQANFSCMQKHDGVNKSGNPNSRTIEVLQQMAKYYESMKDHWRLSAYRRAVAALRKQTCKITTKEEAFAIPFIGERLAAKIEEIVWTNKLQRLENINIEPNVRVLQTFMKIYGVGHIQASVWIDQGHRTFDDLSKKVQLTKNQRIGIEHYDDFLARIPRKEVAAHEALVRQIIRSLDDVVQVMVGGSYRRGAADSGDVDFIITKPGCSAKALHTTIVDTVIPQLFASGYLQAGLAVTSKDSGSKWHGAACLPDTSIWRRVDFLLVPYEEMGAALIYFTGNDIFNRSIRLLASKKGMRLNQRGLWKDVMRGRNREQLTEGSMVEGKSEKRIFEILNVPYRPPEHRIC